MGCRPITWCRSLRAGPLPRNVVRNAGALDASTRTLLTEVQVPNARGELRPGSYAQVRFHLPRTGAGRPHSGQRAGARRHRYPRSHGAGWQNSLPAHCYGPRFWGSQLEVAQGLRGGELLVLNPVETLVEGQAVQTKAFAPPNKPAGPPPARPRPNDPDAPRVSSPVK